MQRRPNKSRAASPPESVAEALLHVVTGEQDAPELGAHEAGRLGGAALPQEVQRSLLRIGEQLGVVLREIADPRLMPPLRWPRCLRRDGRRAVEAASICRLR